MIALCYEGDWHKHVQYMMVDADRRCDIDQDTRGIVSKSEHIKIQTSARVLGGLHASVEFCTVSSTAIVPFHQSPSLPDRTLSHPLVWHVFTAEPTHPDLASWLVVSSPRSRQHPDPQRIHGLERRVAYHMDG